MARRGQKLGAGGNHFRREESVDFPDDEQHGTSELRERGRVVARADEARQHVGELGFAEASELWVEHGARGVALEEVRRDCRVTAQFVGRESAAFSDVCPRGAQLGGVDPAGRIGEHERADALRLGEREAEHGPAAHRLADQVGARDAEVIEQGGEVADGSLGRVRPPARAGAAKTALVPQHDPTRAREVSRLLEPHRMVAARSMREHQCGPVACALEVEAFAIVLELAGLASHAGTVTRALRGASGDSRHAELRREYAPRMGFADETPTDARAVVTPARELTLFRLAIRDTSVPAAVVLGAYYAALVPVHWRTLAGGLRSAVVGLAAATSLALLALAWRWVRRTPSPESFITWLAVLTTLNNVQVMWLIGSVHEAFGFYLTQVGLGFVGISMRRYWLLTAMIVVGFSIGPLRTGLTAEWLRASMMLGATFAVSLMMQIASARYRARLEQATNESERQRAAAEQSLALVREEVAHRERLQERLARGERLQSLGLLAGGVAHDFNNLLAVVIGNATLALARTPQRELRTDLEAILDAGDRAALLAKELLAYAGRGVQNLAPVDLAREVAGVCKLTQSSLPPRVALRASGAEDTNVVRGDRAQLQQVVLNLILNAADATAASGGAIDVSTGSESLSADAASLLEPALPRAAGGYAFLRVVDNGIGMSRETLRRVFDPFYTTKQSGRGLGLAAALGIARAHGGGFRVTSELGKGSEFTLFLPETGEGVEQAAEPRSSAAPGSDATILVVDDQVAVRRMLARALTSAGYRVLEAAGGLEAENLVRSATADVVAAVVDMSMPEVDGEETLRRLRAIRPDLPVLLSSGFDVHEAATRLATLPGVGFLPKPYRVSEIQRRLAELIEASPLPAVDSRP